MLRIDGRVRYCRCTNPPTYAGFDETTGEPAQICAVCERVADINPETILAKARDTYGNINQILVSIEELNELSCALAKYPRYAAHDIALAKTYDKVVEEYADVLIVLEHIRAIFNITNKDVCKVIDRKIKRLAGWLENSESVQYTAEHRE